MASRDPRALLQILAKLEHLRDPGRCNGHRQFRRCVVRGEAILARVGDDIEQASVRVHIRDISWGGLGFVSPEPLPPSSLWRVQFLLRGQIVGTQTMFVRHCRKVDEGVYLIGGQFVADAGLLTILGVDPGLLQSGDSPQTAVAFSFEAPGEVA